ncbi:TPA: restriction endonuclease subunit S [Streptococcus suis]|nr:restriction endonuclease subunit S [Streptococcus suis]
MPDSWEWVRFSLLAEIVRGGSPRPIKEYLTTESDGINWIKIGDTEKGGKYINNVNEKIKPSGLNKTRFVKKGTFLLTNSMSFGRPYILNVDGAIHDGWLAISNYESALDKNFLFYLLSSKTIYSQFLKLISGAVVKNLNSEKVSSTLLPLPPLAEQKRIVAQIERALEKVEAYAENYHKLQELDRAIPDKLKKSILQYAMQGKLVAQDPNDEPVEVLLEKIRAEKLKLYEEGKLKKKDLAEIVAEKGEDNSPYGKDGNFDMDFHRKSNWLLLPLEKVVVSIPTKNHQIKHSDIKEIGMFPVVSQSQVLVEGFSDDKTKVLDNQEHLIIFGDHTRTVKLIDFSFIIGADGVKILQPIGISPQFLKYHLECTILFVKDRGYARHYSYLKNKLIGIPSTDEQNKITNKIDLLFEKVAQLQN